EGELPAGVLGCRHRQGIQDARRCRVGAGESEPQVAQPLRRVQGSRQPARWLVLGREQLGHRLTLAVIQLNTQFSVSRADSALTGGIPVASRMAENTLSGPRSRILT